MAEPYPRDLLPVPLREDYDLNHVSPMMRTQMESGRSRYRQRFTSVPSRVTVTWLLDEGQALYFEGWFKESLNDGTLWFNCPLRTPMGMHEYECHFFGMYQGPQLVANYYKVRARLEIRERPTMDRDWILYGPEYVRWGNIFDIAMNRDWPEQ